MDSIDVKILDMLQHQGRIPNTEIAKELGMAPSGILERIRKLERKGIISGYHAKLNEKATGFDLLGFIWVKLKHTNWNEETGDALSQIPGVLEVYEVTGEYSYLVKFRTESVEKLSYSLKTQFAGIPDVALTQSTIVFSTVKDSSVLPLKETSVKGKKKK